MTQTPHAASDNNDRGPKLADALDDAHGEAGFRENRFFEYWFRGSHGACYFFLFKKNLRVTNLQFAELLALMRTFTTSREPTADPPDLLFVTTDAFKRTVRELMTSMTPERDRKAESPDEESARWRQARKDRCANFSDLYGQVFERTVVVDAFHGSCVVFVPPTLQLDLRAVCAYSGYIHSCGPALWVRSVGKASAPELIDRLRDHLEDTELPQSLAVYAHEDFTQFDRELAAELREGLDDVKVWVEKYWMGDQRLNAVLNTISAEFGDRLIVADPGDYRETQRLREAQSDLDRDRCLWLVLDHAIEADGSSRAADRYYLCYEQQYKNSSPFQCFDENKPAWRAHTTLPHTLTAAMINITLPYRTTPHVDLCDPFVGSATTIIEAAKFPFIHPTGSDKDPLVPQLARDNAEFFALSSQDLDGVLRDLRRAIALIGSEDGEDGVTADSSLQEYYEWARSFAAHLAEHPDQEISLDETETTELGAQPRMARLFFYLGLRSIRRGVGTRQPSEAGEQYRLGWLREAKVLRQQVQQIAKSYALPDHPSSDDRTRVWTGSYSLECAVSRARLQGLATLATTTVTVGDARELPAQSFDVIVTDPPYGFNTDDDPSELAALYREVLETMLRALRNGGQLVLALPERSFTGRETGFFTRREFVEQLIGALAHDLQLDLLDSREVVPTTPDVFRGPYYWESERALRRSILHYRVLQRRRSGDTTDFPAVSA